MLLGIKTKKELFLRHLLVGCFGLLLVYLFYNSYSSWGVEPALWPDWGVDHPFWRAWAHAAFVLLFFTLIIGPSAKLWRPFSRFNSWRRELGVWFAVLATVHGYVILDRWAQWDIPRLFGLEYVESIASYIMSRPEVGIMNLMAVMIFPMIVLLFITSSDRAVSFLGTSAWKWLHNSLIQVIFYVIVLRGVLYFFFFFQPSPPEIKAYPPIWFLYPFLGMALIAVTLQAAAFIKTVLKQRGGGEIKFAKNKLQSMAVVGIGAFLVLPVVLVLGTILFLDSRITVGDLKALTQSVPQNYARSFSMVITENNQEIALWARGLDDAPYLRQTVSSGGKPVAHQIYRYDERVLYSMKLGADGKFVLSKTENVEPKDTGVADIIAGPGVWALQYGIGAHKIQLTNGVLAVTIKSVGGPIDDDVFAVPVK